MIWLGILVEYLRASLLWRVIYRVLDDWKYIIRKMIGEVVLMEY